MELILFAVPQAQKSKWLATLAAIAKDFDESPTSMMCVLGPVADGTQWLTFRASQWAPGQGLACGFFEDVFMLAKRDFVIWQRDPLGSGIEVRRYKAGKLDLHVCSDGSEIAVCHGKVAAKVPRTGDLETFGLAALGWKGPVPWGGFGTRSDRVVLRAAGKVVAKPKVEKGGTVPPKIGIVPADASGFGYWRERAKETFSVVRAAAVASLTKPVRLDVRVGRRSAWIDLSNVAVVTGRIDVIDDYKPGSPYGLRDVDLGGVRECKYPCRIEVSNNGTTRLVGRQLERADEISVHPRVKPVLVDLPKLRVLRRGLFNLTTGGVLELPELVEVKKLEITVGDEPFTLRLPKLAKGTLVITPTNGGDVSHDSVAFAPLLPCTKIEIGNAYWIDVKRGGRGERYVRKTLRVIK
jgi:hypothetical protein